MCSRRMRSRRLFNCRAMRLSRQCCLCRQIDNKFKVSFLPALREKAETVKYLGIVLDLKFYWMKNSEERTRRIQIPAVGRLWPQDNCVSKLEFRVFWLKRVDYRCNRIDLKALALLMSYCFATLQCHIFHGIDYRFVATNT